MMICVISPTVVTAISSEFRQQVRAITQCNDGIDNDGDGFVDFASDPDCVSWEDDNEFSELEITPQPKPIPQPTPQPEPELEPILQPQPVDYIGVDSIQYVIDNPLTPPSNIIQQADTYEDRTRLDSIFSLIMIGILSFGLWFLDFFLNTISK